MPKADRLEKEALIISRLIITLNKAIRPQIYGANHPGKLAERRLVMAAVRNCAGGGVPCTQAQISKALSMPPSTVQGHLNALEKLKLLDRVGLTYIANKASLRRRFSGHGRAAIITAITTAADELRALDGPAMVPGGLEETAGRRAGES